MCGICGLAEPGGAVDAEALGRMSAALVHRGPDSAGAHVEDGVGLAARRLAIIDLAGGDQPKTNEDGSVVVVQNGEIYNHEALRRELEAQGHRFASRCDTEVLAHLYERDGLGFVRALRGMFAIALWDRRHRRLVLARDPFGIKPLVYSARGGRLAFASELGALARAPGVGRELDPHALDAYLAFNSIPSPLTVYRDARKLPPGHLLVWEDGRVRVEEYGRPAPAPRAELRREDADTLAEELRERLADSVRAHLVSDVPVGVLLSGGVDSSVLTALAAEAAPGRLMTFSVGFGERAFDERDDARAVARRYGTEHHEVVLTPADAHRLPEVVADFDEPFGDSSALPTHLVCGLAREHVKVVMSGEGGDELFGGYHTYVADLAAPWVAPAARAARPVLDRLRPGEGRVGPVYMARRFAAGAHLPPVERHHAWKEIHPPARRAALLGLGPGARPDPVEVLRARYARTAGAPALARVQDLDQAVYLVDDLLVKADRSSMAHSLELRVPFLDPVVVGLARALPTAMKVRGTRKKWLLRRAAAPLVPESVVGGRKRGFSIPAAAWLRGPLLPLVRDVLAPDRLRRQGVLDPVEVSRVVDDHVSGRHDLSRQLWGMVALSLWLDRPA